MRALVWLLAVACGGEAGELDAGADAMVRADAGPLDGGRADAEQTHDAAADSGADAAVPITYPTAEGSYDVVHDLMQPSTLPGELASLRAAIQELFDDPGAAMLRMLAFQVAGTGYATAPTWDTLFVTCAGPGDPASGCVAAGDIALTSLGRTAADGVEALADAGAAASSGGFDTVRGAFADAGAVLDGPLRASGQLRLPQDPDETGALGASSMALNLLTVTSAELVLEVEGLARAESIEASLATDGSGAFSLRIEPFELSLRLHQVWMAVLEHVILPRVDVGPVRELFISLIACSDLHARLDADTTSAVADAAEGSCSTIVASAASLAQWPPADLDTSVRLATPPDEACRVEVGGDPLAISAIGSPSAPCTWEAWLQVDDGSGGGEAPMDASFWAQPF